MEWEGETELEWRGRGERQGAGEEKMDDKALAGIRGGTELHNLPNSRWKHLISDFVSSAKSFYFIT